VAAKNGHLEATIFITDIILSHNLKSCLNLRVLDSNFTALDSAAYYGHLRIVKHLIGKKAKIGEALHCADSQRHIDVAEYLISFAPFVLNKFDGMGWTPLAYACKNGDFEMIQLLLIRGATPELNCDNVDYQVNAFHFLDACPLLTLEQKIILKDLPSNSRGLVLHF
jgi:ankyrin repeat protein